MRLLSFRLLSSMRLACWSELRHLWRMAKTSKQMQNKATANGVAVALQKQIYQSKLECDPEPRAGQKAAAWIFAGVKPARIGKETNIVGKANFHPPTDMTCAAIMRVAVEPTAANHRVRGQVPRADRVAKKEITNSRPFRFQSFATDEILFYTDSDVTEEEEVRSETTAPIWIIIIVEPASSKKIELKFRVAEFARRLGNHDFFNLFVGTCMSGNGHNEGD